MNINIIEDSFTESKKLDPSIDADRITLGLIVKKIKKYYEELVNYSIESGYDGNNIFIKKMEGMIIEIDSKLSDSNINQAKAITNKIRWNGTLKQLAWLFYELKNKPSKKKNNDGYYPMIEGTIEELTEFIYNNFECENFSKGTIHKYLKDKNQRTKIMF